MAVSLRAGTWRAPENLVTHSAAQLQKSNYESTYSEHSLMLRAGGWGSRVKFIHHGLGYRRRGDLVEVTLQGGAADVPLIDRSVCSASFIGSWVLPRRRSPFIFEDFWWTANRPRIVMR